MEHLFRIIICLLILPNFIFSQSMSESSNDEIIAEYLDDIDAFNKYIIDKDAYEKNNYIVIGNSRGYERTVPLNEGYSKNLRLNFINLLMDLSYREDGIEYIQFEGKLYYDKIVELAKKTGIKNLTCTDWETCSDVESELDNKLFSDRKKKTANPNINLGYDINYVIKEYNKISRSEYESEDRNKYLNWFYKNYNRFVGINKQGKYENLVDYLFSEYIYFERQDRIMMYNVFFQNNPLLKTKYANKMIDNANEWFLLYNVNSSIAKNSYDCFAEIYFLNHAIKTNPISQRDSKFEDYRKKHIENGKSKSTNIYRLTTGESNKYGYKRGFEITGEYIYFIMFENNEIKESYVLNLTSKDFKSILSKFNSDNTFNSDEVYINSLTPNEIITLRQLFPNNDWDIYTDRDQLNYTTLNEDQHKFVTNLFKTKITAGSKVTQPKNEANWSNNGACREGDFTIIVDYDSQWDAFKISILNGFLIKDSRLEIYSYTLPYTNCYLDGTMVLTYKEKNSNQKWEYKINVTKNFFNIPSDINKSDMKKL